MDLVGHSAGGWLGRAFLADPKYMDSSSRATGQDDGLPHNAAVASLVTLGTPHAPPPPGSKARDMTGGALTWVHNTYPGAPGSCAAVESVRRGDGVRDVLCAHCMQHGASTGPKQRALWAKVCFIQHTLTSYWSCVMVLRPACGRGMADVLAGVLLCPDVP